MHELAVSADHLLGCERDLLNRPTIPINGPHGGWLQVERRRQQPGRFVIRVVDGIHPKDLGLQARNDTRQDQIIPDLGPQRNTIFDPGFDPIRSAGCNDIALVTALKRADLLAIDRSAAFAAIRQWLVAASREVACQA